MTAPATVGWNSTKLRKLDLYCSFVVRMMSFFSCVNLWWLRLCPGTYELTGWPYVNVRMICHTLLAIRSLNILQCMVL